MEFLQPDTGERCAAITCRQASQSPLPGTLKIKPFTRLFMGQVYFFTMLSIIDLRLNFDLFP